MKENSTIKIELALILIPGKRKEHETISLQVAEDLLRLPVCLLKNEPATYRWWPDKHQYKCKSERMQVF